MPNNNNENGGPPVPVENLERMHNGGPPIPTENLRRILRNNKRRATGTVKTAPGHRGRIVRGKPKTRRNSRRNNRK